LVELNDLKSYLNVKGLSLSKEKKTNIVINILVFVI